MPSILALLARLEVVQSSRGSRSTRRRDSVTHAGRSIARDLDFWVLSLWLVIVFLFGGGSRGDIVSLLFLRPMGVLVLGFALTRVTAEQLRANRFILLLAAGCVALVLAHLIPLPPQIWHKLPGRELIVEIDSQAGLGAIWRPLSMAPSATRNALWAMMIPLSVLLLGIQLDTRQRARLVFVILGMGLLSALIALLQVLGDPNGPLFFYRVTNNGSAVGLFANRNHQAVLLATLLPMLVVAAGLWPARRSRHDRAREWLPLAMAVVSVAFLLPLILVTGSRSGLIAAVLALLGAAANWPRRTHTSARPSESDRAGTLKLIVPFALLLLILAGLTVAMGRGIAFERLFGSDRPAELRLAVLPTLISLIKLYGWLGTGIGSFEQVWRVHEPGVLLAPDYLNHAHDDWVEVALTGGLPALALLALAILGFCVRARRLWLGSGLAERVVIGRLGLIVLLLLAIASVFDYPLRVPSLACLAIVAALWALAPEATGESN